MTVTQMVKIAEADFEKLPPSLKARLESHTQGRESKLILFEIPLSTWQELQQKIRSRFPQAKFQFSGGLSTVYVIIPDTVD
jgi:hypothetical protein